MFSAHSRMTHATFRRSHRPVIEAHQRREERGKGKKSLANEPKSDSVMVTFGKCYTDIEAGSKHVGDVGQQLKKPPQKTRKERGKRSNHGFIRRTRRHGSAPCLAVICLS